MIAINLEICDGCGVCVETCPDGALYLVDGKAMVDARLCGGCEVCMTACPRDAILALSQRSSLQAEPPSIPAPRPDPEVIRIRAQPVPVSWRSRMLPLVGATAAWAARELLPVMAEYLLDRLERRAAQEPRATAKTVDGASERNKGGGGRRRRRHRGGQGGAG